MVYRTIMFDESTLLDLQDMMIEQSEEWDQTGDPETQQQLVDALWEPQSNTPYNVSMRNLSGDLDIFAQH